MSPVPLIERQRRLAIIGHVRMGGEKPERGVGRKLENWRLTSPQVALLQQAAELYGGEVTPWDGPNGKESQLYTETPELPVLLMQSYSLDTKYELWEGVTKRTRVCDGYEETISGGPCICNAEGKDRCDFYTRLTVCLPELDTMLGWRLITRGANAADELPIMLDAARALTTSPFVPARLRIDQRRSVVDGQVTRYVVPVLDLGVGYAALAAATDPSRPALVASTSEGLGSGGAALAAATSPPAAAAAPPEPEPEPSGEQTRAASDAQKKKLNVMVGRLREAGHITTDGLYDAVAQRLRNTGGADLAATLDAYDADDPTVLHWSPLRESLTRVEANQLIDWLEKVEAREHEKAVAEYEEAAGEQPEHVTVPYNEFPPGY